MQLPLFTHDVSRSASLEAAIRLMANAEADERGEIFTRPEVVELMLDLIGYHPGADLTGTQILEPACGQGHFLLPAISRLIDSYTLHNGHMDHIVAKLGNAVRAVEIHSATFQIARQRVLALLLSRQMAATDAASLANSWLIQDDFLLSDMPHKFTHIVGNPPYVRQERIPDVLLQHYRARYHTMYDRADLYIPFIERGLSLLAAHGKLAYICSDRWLKNRFGGPLRKHIAAYFHLEQYIDMTGIDAFLTPVTAYPAIFVIGTGKDGSTHVVKQHKAALLSVPQLAKLLHDNEQQSRTDLQHIDTTTQGGHPWVFSASRPEKQLLERLEHDFAPIEAVGCKVGIGVASGNDKIFIRPDADLPIEPERKIPLILARDIRLGGIHWSGNYILNPYLASGALVNLEDYPLFATYVRSQEQAMRQRYVAQKSPQSWYRTIDRIYPALVATPKLLIPDIKGKANVVYDQGAFYPHHNLYYITASQWDLIALQAILRSHITQICIEAYSVRMRGGYLRYQAQNLRRIHLPVWNSLPTHIREKLLWAAQSGDRAACDEAASDAYELSAAERAYIHQHKDFDQE